MPELTERGRDVVVVVGSLLALVLALSVVTPMLSGAWTRDGLVFNVVYFLFVGVLGTNIDVAVVFPASVFAAWILLFIADGYKTVQGVILGLFGVPTFLLMLARLDLWWEKVAWLSYWWAGLLGLLFGAITGTVKSKAGTAVDLHRFPAASSALYVVPSLIVVVALFEVHLEYSSPILWNLRTEQLMTAPVGRMSVDTDGLLVHALGSGVLITVLGIFTQYSSNTTVRVIGPPGPSRANLLGGLFAHAKGSPEYSGVAETLDSDGMVLSRAVDVDRREELPTDPDADAFKFREGLLRRRKIVELEAHLPPEAYQIEKLRRRAERRQTRRWKLVHYLGRVARLAVPNRLLRVRSERTQFLTRIERADVLLLVVPFAELVDDASADLNAVGASDATAGQSYLERYDALCEMYRDSPRKEVVVVVTGAGLAREMLGREKGGHVSFTPGSPDLDELAESLGVEHCTVLAFDREFDDEGTPTDAEGAARILDRM